MIPNSSSPAAGSSSSNENRASAGSVFGVATLIAYLIPVTPSETAERALRRLIDAVKLADPLLTADFQITHELWTPSIHDQRMARIYLPRETHENDWNAFENLQRLKERLSELEEAKVMEVEWAPSKSNDRAQSCSYEITSTEPDPRLRFDGAKEGYDANKRYRLEILNRAIDQVDGVF